MRSTGHGNRLWQLRKNRRTRAAYLRALKGYLYAIPDGHANLLPDAGDFGAKDADIGGGFGIALVQIDSGDVIVSYVANGSAAEKPALPAGDRVTAWNGQEIHDAINATPYIWVTKKPSTLEGIRLQQTAPCDPGTGGNNGCSRDVDRRPGIREPGR